MLTKTSLEYIRNLLGSTDVKEHVPNPHLQKLFQPFFFSSFNIVNVAFKATFIFCHIQVIFHFKRINFLQNNPATESSGDAEHTLVLVTDDVSANKHGMSFTKAYSFAERHANWRVEPIYTFS